MANTTAKKQYFGSSVPVTMVDNGDGTYSEKVAATGGTTTVTGLPASLGQKTAANSTSVTVASDQSSLPVTGLPASLGIKTAANSTSIAPASDAAFTLAATEAHLGQVGGTTAIISPAITTSASPAYSIGDVVGGKITLTNAVRVSGGSGVLQSLLVKDTTNQKAALTILIFNADPSNGTYTDNGAITLNATDATFIIRKINVAASDYETVGTTAIADISAINKTVKAASGTSLFALIVTTGTPTYGANATSLYVNFGILQD